MFVILAALRVAYKAYIYINGVCVWQLGPLKLPHWLPASENDLCQCCHVLLICATMLMQRLLVVLPAASPRSNCEGPGHSADDNIYFSESMCSYSMSMVIEQLVIVSTCINYSMFCFNLWCTSMVIVLDILFAYSCMCGGMYISVYISVYLVIVLEPVPFSARRWISSSLLEPKGQDVSGTGWRPQTWNW